MTNTSNARASVVRGVCRVCHQPVKLAAEDGRVLPHRDPDREWIDCDGAGYLPAEATR